LLKIHNFTTKRKLSPIWTECLVSNGQGSKLVLIVTPITLLDEVKSCFYLKAWLEYKVLLQLTSCVWIPTNMIASDVLPIVIQQNRKKEKNTFESLRIREKNDKPKRV